MTPRESPELLTVPEVASFLRMTPKAVRTAIERNQIPGVVRIGHRVRVSRKMLERALDESAATTPGVNPT